MSDGLLPYRLIDHLAQEPPVEVTPAERTKIALRCHDADDIPKVKEAGMVKQDGKISYQIMHNGLKVRTDGYYGNWMTDLITKLKGHHEPQEEKVFYELAKLFRPGTTMIELGAYWSFYSLWFHKDVKDAFNLCCEPDQKNLQLGQANFALNGFSNVKFVNALAGSPDKKTVQFQSENASQPQSLTIRTVDSLVKEHDIKKLEVLHIDVQGAEYQALKGAAQTIKAGKLRFVFVSTHHYLISRDPAIHERCLTYIKELGGHIICEHEIHESFSGDGLIVASFEAADKDVAVAVSYNRMSASQFRPYTKDLELSFKAYEDKPALVAPAPAKRSWRLRKSSRG